ncbi:hypothetical protein R1sor_009317 [Riccia sorocarpa]|uniref:Replitron HUH endonuclease domain-containing protein n=1 Tax=Riccia sorocarpa TaxID=122646 RepID=A0ABD3HWP3_9MARC
MDVSITTGQVGSDVAADVFDKTALYIQQEVVMVLIAFERDETNLQLHIQGVMTIIANSIRSINTDLTKAIGWDTHPPEGGVVCIKSVKNQGLHTVTGLIGYCLKVEEEHHFRVYMKNVSEQQMEEGKKWQYLPELKWLVMPSASKVHAERLWLTVVHPEAVTMTKVDHIFFNYDQSDRYFEVREPGQIPCAPANLANPTSAANTVAAAAVKEYNKRMLQTATNKPPPTESEVESSPWTDPHPVDFIEVDLDAMTAEVQGLLNAGFGFDEQKASSAGWHAASGLSRPRCRIH